MQENIHFAPVSFVKIYVKMTKVCWFEMPAHSKPVLVHQKWISAYFVSKG